MTPSLGLPFVMHCCMSSDAVPPGTSLQGLMGTCRLFMRWSALVRVFIEKLNVLSSDFILSFMFKNLRSIVLRLTIIYKE